MFINFKIITDQEPTGVATYYILFARQMLRFYRAMICHSIKTCNISETVQDKTKVTMTD